MSLRLLITGSRSWTDQVLIGQVLREVWKDYGEPADAVMVNGRCPRGADKLGEIEWRRMGLSVEPYPAEWDKYPHYAAGAIRNKQMVETGADVCVAFMVEGSTGTSGCIELAEDAGIPVRLYLSTWAEQHPGEEEDPVEASKRAGKMEKYLARQARRELKRQKAADAEEARKRAEDQIALF